MSAAYESARHGDEEHVYCMPGPATSGETAQPGTATSHETRPARADKSSNFTIKLLSVAACIHTVVIVALVGVCVYMYQIQAPKTEATVESNMTTFQTVNTTQSEWTTLNSQIAGIIATQSTAHSEIANLKSQTTTLQAKVTTLEAKVTTLEAKVTTLEGKVTTLAAEHSSTQSQMTTLAAAQITTQSQMTTLKTAHNTTHSQMVILKSLTTTLEAKMTSEMASFQKELATSNANLENLKVKSIGFSVKDPKSKTTSGKLIFGTVRSNERAVFDLGAGEFVCQQSGFYFFALSILKNYYHNGDAMCAIERNGGIQVVAATHPGHSGKLGRYAATNSVYIHLATGDKVTVGPCSSLSSLDSASSFTGFLVKADTV